MIKIKRADCTDQRHYETPFIDLTVTSPPYNLDIAYGSNDDNLGYDSYLQFTERWLSNLYKGTKSSGRLCLNVPLDTNKGGQRSVGSDITQIAQQVGWKYQSTIIWYKQNMSSRTAWGSWKSASAPYVVSPVELIVTLYKDVWKKNYKGTSDISRDDFIAWTNGMWSFNGESAKRVGHPAPYPRELPLRCIKMFSYVGDHVFDPFMGSGTTGMVAKETGRSFTGIELDKGYYELAKKRIKSVKVAQIEPPPPSSS